jgi:drug/metabolite transporter (DMT)-like permease
LKTALASQVTGTLAVTSSRTLRAIVFLCLGIFLFSLQDAIIKSISGSYPVAEIIVIRSLAALPVILCLIIADGGLSRLVAHNKGWLVLRGLFMLFSYTFYYLAFPAMKLADVLALYATLPLFITLLAGLVLGESVGLRRWAAVGVGFIGALIMLRPDLGAMAPASLLPIAAALSYATAQLMARRLGPTNTAPVMAFYQNLIYFGAASVFALTIGASPGKTDPSLAFLLRPWHQPPMFELALMAVCGPIAAFGMTLLAQAYRTAPANIVASFEYSSLLWATLWGFTLFGEIPGTASLVGAALIVGSGLSLIAFSQTKPADKAGG